MVRVVAVARLVVVARLVLRSGPVGSATVAVFVVVPEGAAGSAAGAVIVVVSCGNTAAVVVLVADAGEEEPEAVEALESVTELFVWWPAPAGVVQ